MKCNYLQTQTVRRSLCSNEYFKGTDPLVVIQAISGHRSHKSFIRYIKASGDQFADKLEKISEERNLVIKLLFIIFPKLYCNFIVL
jgi:hypothetical protein